MSIYSTFIDTLTAPDGRRTAGDHEIERRFEAHDEDDAAKLACAAYMHENDAEIEPGTTVSVLVLRQGSTHPFVKPDQWTINLYVRGSATVIH